MNSTLITEEELAALRADKARLDELERIISSCAVLTYYPEKGRAEFLHGASGYGSLRQFLDERINERKAKA